MWQCTFCNFTSNRKGNVQRHEKRKHSSQLEKMNNEVQNARIEKTTDEMKNIAIQTERTANYPTPTIEQLEESIEVFKIYKLLQRMKNKE